MITKYGKIVDFRALKRDIKFINAAGKQNEKVSLNTFNNGVCDEINACPICKSREKSTIKEINKSLWRKCKECGHLFVSNPPASKNVSDIYMEGNEAQKLAYISEELFFMRRKIIARPKAEFINEVVRTNGNKHNLLVDVGCGVGELLCEASALGWKTIGFEAGPAEVDFARNHGVNIIQTYLDGAGGSSPETIECINKAEVVCSLNVMEHIIEPIDWVSWIVSHMKKGAYLVLEVPREPSLTTLCNLIGLPYKHLYTAGHYHVFTEKSMEILASDCSLELTAKWCFGNGFMDIINTALFLGDSLNDNSTLDLCADASNRVQKVIDEMGLSEMMMLIYRVV